MASSLPDLGPTVILQQADKLPNFHVSTPPVAWIGLSGGESVAIASERATLSSARAVRWFKLIEEPHGMATSPRKLKEIHSPGKGLNRTRHR